MKTAKSVDEYIGMHPADVQVILRKIRKTIKDAAPDTTESISYGMPFYSFKGESGFQARLCYFGLLKNNNKIAFYTRPMALEEYMDKVKTYMTTKSALQFPIDKPIPYGLIGRIVKTMAKKHMGARAKKV